MDQTDYAALDDEALIRLVASARSEALGALHVNPCESVFKVLEVRMAGFLGKLKSGADKAAFEADRLVRLNQAQSALKGIQRELDAELLAMGQQAVALYDTRVLTQPELVALMPTIDSLRERVAAQEAEVERIRGEKPPEAGVAGEQPESEPAPPDTALQGHVCTRCNTPLKPDARFCPECGFRVADM